MRKRILDNIMNLFLPCIALSVAAGVFSAIIITAFRLVAETVIGLSAEIYAAIRENPIWLPILVLGAAAVGFIASLLYFLSQSCRGGGIPSSVATIRGVFNFKWWVCILLLPVSALMSFFSGLPLGTEGPCVQLGTAVGDGVTKCFAPKKQKGWRRYIMTGGASAGFSIAASSPITAIIFAMEELHKQFSPLIMMVASISVMSAHATVQALSSLGIGSLGLFDIPQIQIIEPRFLWAPLAVGIICGVGSLLFSVFYKYINEFIHYILKKVSVNILFPLLFGSVAIVGFFMADTLGTGHSLIEKILSEQMLWYVIILLFLIRAIVMVISNTAGVTGGIFLPTLSFGALLGALTAKAMISLGFIGEEHYILIVVLGIAAFLGATSHVPITACVFAIETLGGFGNALSVIIAVTVSFLAVEMFEGADFTDTVIASKIRSINKGRHATIVDVPLTVCKGSFAVGKNLHDILWPNSCYVVSIKRSTEQRTNHKISEGDIITVHYKTYCPMTTAEELTVLMGEQSEQTKKLMIP